MLSRLVEDDSNALILPAKGSVPPGNQGEHSNSRLAAGKLSKSQLRKQRRVAEEKAKRAQRDQVGISQQGCQ